MSPRTLLVFLCLLTIVYCQNNVGNFSFNHRKCKKKHHHHGIYHLLYGGGLFYYLSFLVIKIKVVFVLGTIFTIFLVSGKVWGLVKYIEATKHKDYHHHEPEKIYIQAPSHHHHIPHDSMPYSAPSSYTVDKLPPGAEISGGGDGGQYFNSPPPSAYGRSSNNDDNETFDKFQTFFKMLKTIDTTDIAFKTMKLQGEQCKKRFVCKADFDSKHSIILATALNWLSDEKYNSYKTNEAIDTLEDCERLYPDCNNTKI